MRPLTHEVRIGPWLGRRTYNLISSLVRPHQYPAIAQL